MRNSTSRKTQDPHSDRMLARRAIYLVSAVAFLLGAAAIHAAQIRVHLNEWDVAGYFFILSAVLQVALAVGLARVANWRACDVRQLLRSLSRLPSRRLMLGVVIISAGLAAVWVLSRTVGVPFGPHAGTSEPVNRPDSIATMFELLTVALMLPLLRRRSSPRTAWRPRRIHSVVVGVLLLSTVATTAVALQPTSCETAGRVAEAPTKKEQANQVLIDALLNHAGEGAHTSDPAVDQGEHDEGQPHAEEASSHDPDCH